MARTGDFRERELRIDFIIHIRKGCLSATADSPLHQMEGARGRSIARTATTYVGYPNTEAPQVLAEGKFIEGGLVKLDFRVFAVYGIKSSNPFCEKLFRRGKYCAHPVKIRRKAGSGIAHELLFTSELFFKERR